MKRQTKYYILKRLTKDLVDSLISEISDNIDKRKIIKAIDITLPLLLIEKTINIDNNIETYTNLWTIDEGCTINWTKHIKNKLMYDYTGVYYPLIHIKGNVYTWDEYKNSKQFLNF